MSYSSPVSARRRILVAKKDSNLRCTHKNLNKALPDLESCEETTVKGLKHMSVVPGEVCEDNFGLQRITKNAFVKDVCWVGIEEDNDPRNPLFLGFSHAWMQLDGSPSIELALQKRIILVRPSLLIHIPIER